MAGVMVVPLIDGHVLLVGETRSLEDFESVRLFVSGVVRALTWFSNDLKTMWHLNTHHTKQSLLTATDGLTYTGGRGVRTEEALYYINHETLNLMWECVETPRELLS
ncbi:hypothetical protein INR49_019339 [Caranx melampygus]|nr:hypothetical protein INR49_019339 [Caranx melampygus]